MIVECIDDSDLHGVGKGLVTKGRRYVVLKSYGGYYDILCDDGTKRSKDKRRFKNVRIDE